MKVVQAVGDKVVAEVIMQEKKTSGGIILPVNVDKDPQSYGEVLSVGEEVENVKVGDIIIFHRNGGMAIMINRKIMKVLVNKEIYGIVKDVDAAVDHSKLVNSFLQLMNNREIKMDSFLIISFVAMVLSVILLLAVMFFKLVVMLNCVKFLVAATIASGVFGLTLLCTRMIN